MNINQNGWIRTGEPNVWEPVDLYKLNCEQMEIRLLEISPEHSTDFHMKCLMSIARCSFDTCSALSYAWGDPTMAQQIVVNDEKINVTTSLYSALRPIRQRQQAVGKKVRLWADALCINQKDVEERREQVSMMGDIYSRGSAVIVWLGDEGEYTKEAFAHFHE